MRLVPAAVLLSLASLVAGAAAAVSSPLLALARSAPLTVRGSGFVPRERVIVRSGTTAAVGTRALATGTFVVQIGSFDRCAGGRVVATGTAGDRAVLRLPPLLCAPAAPP